MQLSEKIILRRYNALANDWTPLSRKPCWLSIAFHCLRDYVKRNRFSWFHRLVTSSKNYPTHHMLHLVGDKSFADDLVASGYCKYESNLCVTIYWDFCRVPSICSSLIQFIIARRSTTKLFLRLQKVTQRFEVRLILKFYFFSTRGSTHSQVLFFFWKTFFKYFCVYRKLSNDSRFDSLSSFFFFF